MREDVVGIEGVLVLDAPAVGVPVHDLAAPGDQRHDAGRAIVVDELLHGRADAREDLAGEADLLGGGGGKVLGGFARVQREGPHAGGTAHADEPGRDRHVLPSVHLVGHRGRRAGPDLRGPELLAGSGVERGQARTRAPEDKAACGGHGSAVSAGALDSPLLAVLRRIPGQQHVVGSLQGRPRRPLAACAANGPRVPDPCLVVEAFFLPEVVVVVRGGEVDEPRRGAPRHGVPVVRSTRPGGQVDAPAGHPVAGLGSLQGTAGRKIDPGGPGQVVREGLGRDEFAGEPVDDVEEAVLRGLHDDLPLPSADLEVQQHERLGGGVVPSSPGVV